MSKLSRASGNHLPRRPQYLQLYQNNVLGPGNAGKLPVSLSLPPCTLLWSGPAWSQARNNHYCLTRKAASSAEGGASPRDTLFSSLRYQVVTEHLPAPPWWSAHLGEGLGVQMWLLEKGMELLLCQAPAQPGMWTK